MSADITIPRDDAEFLLTQLAIDETKVYGDITRLHRVYDAIRAQLAPPTRPEPEDCRVALDKDGCAWLRAEDGWWWMAGGDTSRPYSWAALWTDFGPLVAYYPEGSSPGALTRHALIGLMRGDS